MCLCPFTCLLVCLHVCLFDCFLDSCSVFRWFVIIGLLGCVDPTQWLQPLHRAKQKTGDVTIGSVEFVLLVSFFVSLFFD